MLFGALVQLSYVSCYGNSVVVGVDILVGQCCDISIVEMNGGLKLPFDHGEHVLMLMQLGVLLL